MEAELMYAVIKTGGKQYKVAKNDVILVEKLAGEAGATVELNSVLMVGDDKGQTVGSPLVAGAHVAATVLEQTRGKKVIVFKKKRRKNYRRTAGHRQDLTALRITDIVTGGRKKAAAKEEAPKAKETKVASKTADKKADSAADALDMIEAATDMPVTETAPKDATLAAKKAAAKPAPKKAEAKPAAKKTEAKPAAKKTPAKKSPAKKEPAKKAPAKKAAAKTAAAKPAAAKKAPAKKPAAKKPAAKKKD